MKQAYFPVPVGRTAPTGGGASADGAKAYKSLEGLGVTWFSTPNSACLAYAGSVFWSSVLIAFDIILLRIMANSASVSDAVTTYVSVDNGINGWASGMAATVLVMDIMVLVSQAIDLYYFHFTIWPLTMITWFGQLNGTGISSALLGMMLHYPFADAGQRDLHLTIALLSLAAHALFISSQFAVTLEYIVRKLNKLQ